MNQPAPPEVFSPSRRRARHARHLAAARAGHTPDYLIADMVEDVIERLGFLRVEPRRALVIGDWTGALAGWLTAQGAEAVSADPLDLDQERPLPFVGFDLIASLGMLDTANDLPGALIHIRNALAPGGLALASFVGAGSLPALRAAMLEADGDRPAPRLHPMVDVRAGGQLLQRAGWGDPVVDSRTLQVRFSSLESLVADLRAQGLSNCLARSGPPLSRQQYSIVKQQFGTGRVETFEILTLTGWRR